MKKKLVVLLAAMVLIVSSVLTGCAGPNTPKTEQTEIEILTWHGPESATNYYDGYKEIADAYMADHKDVKITIKYEDDATYGNILETGFAGGTAPDIIQMKSAQRSTFSTNLMNLKGYLNEKSAYDTRNEKWIDNFVGGEAAFPLEDNGEDANSILFMPNDSNPEVYAGSIYIFNKEIIKNAGLDPDQTPVTWKEMFEWLEALSGTGEIAPIAGSSDVGGKVSQIGYGFGEKYADNFFDEEINDEEFRADLFYDKVYVLTSYEGGTSMPLDNLPYYPAMFKLMKQHIGYYQKSWTENSFETEILSFANGRAALMMTSYYDFDTITSSLLGSKFGEGYGVFPAPYFGGETLDYAVSKGWITQEEADAAAPYAVTRRLTGGGIGRYDYGFSVNQASAEDEKKLTVILDFLQYMSSKDVQEKYVKTANSLSPIVDVPLVEGLTQFVIEEPEGGFAQNVLGYTVVEWGKGGWDVEITKYLNGEISMEEMVTNVSAAEWAGDIPALEVLQENVTTAEVELNDAGEEEKDDKERALKYAQLRLKLYSDYYYNMTGDLKEIN